MKTYRWNTGPFVERPFFTIDQIEQMCFNELQQVGLYPQDPSPIRIDRFAEKRFHISISYDDLPPGLLGFTEFSDKGVSAIVVANALDDDRRHSERRIRTTVAHEVGHGLLHTHLMVLGAASRQLFDGGLDPDLPRILCRSDSSAASTKKKYDGKWWEFQANQAMGALLLPRGLVEKALEGLVVPQGIVGKRMLDAANRDAAVSVLAGAFDVNPIVGKHRLEALYPEYNSGQLTL